jgi:hypothetical protein
MENAAIHVEQSEKSSINIDKSAGSMWMTDIFGTPMLWACVTRLFYSVFA